MAILEEANIAFELNSGLFTVLKPPSHPRPADADAAPTLLESKEDSKVIYSAQPEPSNSSFSVAGVAAFILAMSLAQLFIIFGGLTGEKGSAKFDTVLRWFSGSA